MMPDKNDTSDNAINNIVDGAEDDVGSTQTASGKTNGAAAAASENGPEAANSSTSNTTENQDPSIGKSDPDIETVLDEAINAERDDPLGFGDQRMNSESDPTEPQDELSALRTQLVNAEAKASEHWDRLLRMQADMENQRKRAQNDVSKARKFALEGIVSDLLPVKDSLEMGLAAAQSEEADPKAIVEGAELTLKMLAQVFEKNNILELNPVDEKFDPEFHQAMSMQEIVGKPANTVATVMQKGYTLNNRLVRPALVMVTK